MAASDSDQQPRARPAKPSRSLSQRISWWWNTRIRSLWTVRLPAATGKQHASDTIEFRQVASQLADAHAGDITAILTVYRRGQYLAAQIEALRKQTHPPAEIWVWTNQSDLDISDFSALADRVIVSNTNWKFWGRFALANMVRTEYVSLFDDDILPQPQWFENCLATITNGYDGILGGSGVILPAAGGYSSKHKVGWNGHHLDTVAEVDLVGHAWFFHKRHLKYMWEEQPHSWENGEDIHFSCMAMKHGDIATYVPPHPQNQPLLWSCRPDFGKSVGRTSSATFKSEGHHTVRDDVVNHCRKNGWQIVAERDVPA